MYIIFALFLISLIGIAGMIGRKWMLIQNGYVFEEEPVLSEKEYWEEFKEWAQEGLRRLGFVLLVVTIRIYVKISTLLHKGFRKGTEKIRTLRGKSSEEIEGEAKSDNKFLKMMKDYKKKVRRIKEKVKKEERTK